MRTFGISGWVIDRKTARGLGGLRVEAWDHDGLCPDLVDCAVTNSEGHFELSISEQHVQELFGERLPDLSFRIFSGSTLVVDAPSGALWKLSGPATTLRIRVDADGPLPGGKDPAPYLVRGRVAHALTGPAATVRVRAFDRRLAASGTREVLLGEATTDARGMYQITYSLGSGAPKLKADLLVRAVDDEGALLAESPALCRAPTTARVDLVIGGPVWAGPSEYERLMSRLDPLLTEAELRLAQLDEDSVAHLACSAGLDREVVGRLHTAARLAEATRLHAELFFALASQGLPLDLPALLTHDAKTLRASVARATAGNIVAPRLAQALAADIDSLLPLIVDAALAAPPLPDRLSLGEVLAAGLQPIGAQQALLTLYQNRTADGEAFWEQVARHFDDPGVTEDLRLSVQLGLLTQGHIALLQQLRARREQGTIKRLDDLLNITETEWRTLVDAAGGEAALPPHITGATAEERVERFLSGVLHPLRTTFPGLYLRRALENSANASGPVHLGLVQLLTNLPDLDVRAANLDQALEQAGEGAYQGIPAAERPAVVRQLKAIQRLFRITHRAEAIVGLIGAGIDSALSIAQVSRKRFVQQYAGVFGGEAAARLAHAQARHHAACAHTAYLALRQAAGDPAPWAISGGASAQANGQGVFSSPDLPTLFGPLELCECKHCQSVYSPAAYFVDLLQFLDCEPGSGAVRPVDVLFGRRPDLKQIALTCSNTNTPIPYIDLVNEVLEAYVKARFVDGQSPVADLPAYDTGDATAADLRAAPQHIEESAYTHLAAQVYPPTLPFHRPLLVLRTHLEHLGTTRLQVLETFPHDDQPSERDLVTEALAMAPMDYSILAGVALDPPRLLREFYGYATNTVTRPDGSGTESWRQNLARVPEFLRRTGISYLDLIELVKTWFVNRNQSDPAQRMLLESSTSDCDLTHTAITHLTDPALERMHRMLRLQRFLGLSLADLDRTLFALGVTEIDAVALRKLADAKRLSAELGRPIPELLPLWADIDTWGTDALYLRLFQDRAVLAHEDVQAFALHYPTHDPDIKSDTLLPHLDAPDVLLGQHHAVLLAVLRITGPDLARLCARLALTEQTPLTVAILSALHRHAWLARVLGLRVPELLSLLDLVVSGDNVHPFMLHEPSSTLAFVAKVRKLQASSFKVAEVDYLLRHHVEPGQSPAPAPAHVESVLAKIQGELARIAAETALPDDPTGAELERRLSLVVDVETAQYVMALILETTEHGPGAKEFLKDTFPHLVNTSQEFDQLALPPLSDEQRLANIAWFHDHLAPWLRDTISRRAVIEVLATAVGLDVPLTNTLLSSLIQGRVTAGTSALDDFLQLAETPSSAAHAETYEILHKAALLIRGFGLGEREIVYVSSHASDFAGFNINELPLTPAAGAAGSWFVRWERLADLVRLRDQLGTQKEWLIDLFEREVPTGTVDSVAYLTTYLAERTGWDAIQLAAITGASGLVLDEADFRTELRLLDVAACVSLASQIGVSASTLFTWAAEDPSPAHAREVAQAVRARAGTSREQWLDVARALNDRLRETQRSALVDFLVPRLADEGVTSADQLFEHFLIDTQMSACMATSRIKQATSSVQLFVQRCLLGLERSSVPSRDVEPATIDADQWTWRKNYRVWEANRKVFLYPENWLEPELRDNKSPFFRELETELLQQDLSDTAVEQALTHYLEKLDDVARLEVCGMYWQQELADSAGADDTDVLHVFGRTWNEPRVYHYRRFENRRTWTPWERVPLDIQSDHLIPVVYNRRLYLFWAIFTVKPHATQVQNSEAPEVYWDIKLAWSEYRQGKWSAKRTSKGSYTTTQGKGVPPQPPADISFIVQRGSSTLFLLEGSFFQQASDIYRFHQRGIATLNACNGEMTINGFTAVNWSNIHLPHHGKAVFMDVELDTTDELVIERPKLGQRRILNAVKTPARMHLPRDFDAFYSDKLLPFFWQDSARTYFARPVDTRIITAPVANPDHTLEHPVIVIDISTGKIPPVNTLDTQQGFRSDLQNSLLSGTDWSSTASLQPGVTQPLGTVLSGNVVLDSTVPMVQRLLFSSFEHPYVCDFTKALRRGGIDSLLTLANQHLSRDTADHDGNYFQWNYEPTDLVHHPHPTYDIDFSPEGAYSLYNWELFFHAPWLIAARLSQEQRHAEAQRWFHFIFDPTTDSSEEHPARFWNVQPFRDNTDRERAQDLLALLSYPGNDPVTLARKRRVEDQVAEWAAHPFQPHRIARLRLVAYQKAIVMKYIDNLLAWGDQLFRSDTIESINEATQLYILAKRILGPRLERVPARSAVTPKTYAQLRNGGPFDNFSNVLVDVENIIFPFALSSPTAAAETGADAILAAGKALYFCTPPNDKLLEYWDIVDDRLFKIRNCMNIEGVVRELPLFEPPIDPAFLVRAAAAGVSLSEVLADLNAPLPFYRFSILLQKAMEMVGELRSLAAALLAALEKKDSEALSNLRATHETGLLKAVRRQRERQVAEAEAALAGLEKTRKVMEERHRFYRDIQERSSFEKEQLERLQDAQHYQDQAHQTEIAVAAASQLPNATVGTNGVSPVLTATFGGLNLVAGLQGQSRSLTSKGGLESYKANLASIKGAWARRSEEWKFQERLAAKEVEQIDKQIIAAQIRLEIAKLDLQSHERQIENATTIEEFLRDRFTNEELYGWMVTQTSSVYTQAYKLAYDLAKRAERAYRYERGLTSSDFIQPGYWEDLRRGLLAADRLALDLRRLESAYLEQNRREYELVKNISLPAHDPFAFLKLRETGKCELAIPEWAFDLDHPGHYFRRIKTVAVTAPAVTGAYAGVNGRLTLRKSVIRSKSTLLNGNYQRATDSDGRFIDDYTTQSIVTSSGQADSGLFELNLRDERLLPFEGAGAESEWELEFAPEHNQLGADGLTDLVLQVRYTAQEGGGQLREAAKVALRGTSTDPAPESLRRSRLISVKHDFPNEWRAFQEPVLLDVDDRVLTLPITRRLFDCILGQHKIKVIQADLFTKWTEKLRAAQPTPGPRFHLDRSASGGLDLVVYPDCGLLTSTSVAINDPVRDTDEVNYSAWILKAKRNDNPSGIPAEALDDQLLRGDALEDIWLVLTYTPDTPAPVQGGGS